MVNAASDVIELILADSNPLVLSAMAEAFEKDGRFSVVATTATAEGFLSLVTRVSVQVAVIDWELPALGGAKLIEVLRDQAYCPKMVVYGENAKDAVRKAMAAGAAAFAPRSSNIETLLETCENVAAGKMVFPFLDVRTLRDDPIETLSRKERAILEALATGMTNKELSAELEISTNTVKFHLSNIFDKLGVKNRTQAIAYFYASQQRPATSS